MADALAMIAACMRHQPAWPVPKAVALCATCGDPVRGSAIVVERAGLSWHGACFTREELYRSPS